MDLSDFFQLVIRRIETLRIPYFVTGGFASIAYGEPRLTLDIDVVIEISGGHIKPLCQAFPLPEFYLSEDAIRHALHHGQMFNVIHPESGLKADFMISADTAFAEGGFLRARRIEPIAGFSAMFASPEDVILNKLLFARQGLPDRHLRDIAGILLRQGDALDYPLLNHWAMMLGVTELWTLVLKHVKHA